MAYCFKEFFFLFFFIFIFSCKPSTLLSVFSVIQFSNHFPVFNQTPKSKFNSPVLISLKSFVRRKPIPMFDPRPLCCSSLTTAVGGTTDTNFVDSAHLTMARIRALHSTQMEELLLLTVTSPSLQFRLTGSLLQFTLTSPFNALQTDRLPPIIRIDEPFTAYQSDGLLFTISIDELSPQLRWTSSYYSQ